MPVSLHINEYGESAKGVDSFEPSSWCRSRRKRLFDIMVSVVLLVPFIPLIPLIILLVRLDSPGPVLFVHHRVGVGGKDFRMFKFRTMVSQHNAPLICLTRAGDQRITRVGRILRKWKLDELPQLWNVVRGDMSMVGPRPHIRRLLDHSSNLQDFLSIRPGITGKATIRFKREEEILPNIPYPDLESYYIERILPEKVQLDVRYAEEATFWSDLTILLSTGTEVFLRGRTVKAIFPLERPRSRWWPSRTTIAAAGVLLLVGWVIGGNRSLHRSVARADGVRQMSGSGAHPSDLNSQPLQAVIAKGSSNTADSSVSQTTTRTYQGIATANVWVDSKSGLYYCPSSDLYGTTKGKIMSERDAQRAFRSASRPPCDSRFVAPNLNNPLRRSSDPPPHRGKVE